MINRARDLVIDLVLIIIIIASIVVMIQLVSATSDCRHMTSCSPESNRYILICGGLGTIAIIYRILRYIYIKR